WEMGETGPCGPCSEIHLDLGPEACNKVGQPHTCNVNGDCSRYIELWNLVFIQYNRISGGALEPLPKTHVDTGAGLERLTAYLQGTFSNYATDLFVPLIHSIESLTSTKYSDGPQGMPHRVLADHVRTLSFAIADNVLPSNDGRGYVLRRLLRRATRYARQLGAREPIIYRLVKPLVDNLGGHFTHLAQRQNFIESLIMAEEESFLRTLESGISIFESMAGHRASTVLSGEDAFKLYDTYGFPLDLTQLMARERGFSVDEGRFNVLLEERRAQSRKAVKLHASNYTEVPMGGEARIVEDPIEKLEMARHHTGTHLLQAALRKVLGEHVHQSGSLVDTDRLRFDFSHFKALSAEELKRIESEINSAIKADIGVEAFKKPIDEAKAMGALALFGEKYDDIVRVIKIGDVSMELCGGTHVGSTGEIETLKIISESAISAGTRRIEAIAGTENILHFEQLQRDRAMMAVEGKIRQLIELESELKELGSESKPTQISDLESLSKNQLQDLENELIRQIKSSEKAISDLKAAKAGSESIEYRDRFKPLSGATGDLLAEVVPGFDLVTLRNLADNLTNTNPKGIVILGSSSGDTGYWVVKLGKEATQLGHTAPELIGKLTQISGGKGGGRADMAQAGGADPTRLVDALDSLKSLVRE
ncbi:hypothetical protein EBR96_03480, partial [bacterium]|nr:hypothetical protein [bacterium]